MNPVHTISTWFRSLWKQRGLKREIDEELRFHLEQRTAENIAKGMSANDAAREARKQFGNFQSVREDCRQMRGVNFGERFIQDGRFGLRILRKKPGFTTVAMLTLALGIGLNTAMFSVLKELLFYPVPYPQPNALVRIGDASCFQEQRQADFLDEREQNTVFSHLAAFQCWLDSGNLSLAAGSAQAVTILRTTGNFFDTLEVGPALGTLFTEQNNEPGRDQVVVLSHQLWMSLFNGNTNIVGHTVRLDGNPVTVIGVMPPMKLAAPLLFGGRVDVIKPLTMTTRWRQNREGPNLSVVGRLKPDASLNQARVEMTAIGQRLKAQYPKTHPNGFWLQTQIWGRSIFATSDRNQFILLLGLTTLVLLIACANLANLQLAQMAGRSRELGIRVALGAGRGRVVRQLLTENLMLSLLGGALGLVLAFACDWFLANRFNTAIEGFSLAFPLDRYVMIFTLLTVILTTILVGVAPAWLMSRSDAHPSLKENSRASLGGRSRHRLQSAFVVVQLVLALALLTATGQVAMELLTQALRNPGWQPDKLWTADINMARPSYDSPQKQINFFRQLADPVGALPGVTGVSWCSALPFQYHTGARIKIEARPDVTPQRGPLIYWHQVGPEFFKTMGMTLRQGRDFTADEIENDSPVVVINQTLARKLWPEGNPVGQRIIPIIKLASNTNWLTIIGVVDDVAGNDDCHIYWPPGGFTIWTLVIRSHATSQAMAPALRQMIAAIDPNLPVPRLETAGRVYARSQAIPNTLEGSIIAFGILGLFLAVIGVYGVTAYTVSQRTGELGIRMALGAQRGNLLWLILRRGLRHILAGAVLGIVGAIGILHVVATVDQSAAGPPIFAGISKTDWLIIISVSAVLIGTGMLACYLPARRATRIDPMNALRYE